jgi:hypothetical protein
MKLAPILTIIALFLASCKERVVLKGIIIDDSRIGLVGALTLGLAGMSFGIWCEYRRAKSRRGRVFSLALGFLIAVIITLLFVACFFLIR